MRDIGKRLEALELRYSPAEPITIIRQIIEPSGVFNPSVARCAGNQILRDLGESIEAFTKRAADTFGSIGERIIISRPPKAANA